MKKQNNRVCKVCQSPYHFCPTCERVAATEKYKTMFCSKNCRDIFHTCTRFAAGTIDKSTAKSILSDLDLSNRSNFSEQIKADLSNILKIKNKFVKKEIAPIEEPIVIESTVVVDEEQNNLEVVS